MERRIRVRFAPSPTGEPHVGNLRTALFNWLFARRYGGTFVLRVEDTDRERYVEGALSSILDSLRWLGLDWDEGPEVGGPHAPYFQSERLELYQGVARDLMERDRAYLCYCSRERLEALRRDRQHAGLTAGYDRHCRELAPGARRERESSGTVPVVRFKMPLTGESGLDDLVRGPVAWENALLDDFVLLKSDGFPTYHLANVVDDHLMEISHVLRAEEWLPSTPRHLQLYSVLGYEPPLFGHLPMILGPDRAKLSKRHGATSALEYRERGFLPEAMVNFMALLGWSLDDKTDVISRDELVRSFSLERIGKAGAIFDHEKLLWMNGVYIRGLEEEQLAERMLPFLDGYPGPGQAGVDRGYLRRVAPLVRERLKTLADVREHTYFFDDDITCKGLVQKGMDHASTRAALSKAGQALGALDPFDAPSLEEALRSTAAQLQLSGRQLFGALRVAVTGRTAAPPLFETMEVLGKQRCLDRIAAALRALEKES